MTTIMYYNPPQKNNSYISDIRDTNRRLLSKSLSNTYDDIKQIRYNKLTEEYIAGSINGITKPNICKKNVLKSCDCIEPKSKYSKFKLNHYFTIYFRSGYLNKENYEVGYLRTSRI